MRREIFWCQDKRTDPAHYLAERMANCFSETWSLTMLNFCKVYWMNNLHQIRQTEKTIFKTDNCLVADTAKVRTFDQIRAHVDRSRGFKCKISV